MTAKQSKRARREAARRARQRRQRMIWAVASLAVVVAVGAFIGTRGGSPDQAAALAPHSAMRLSRGYRHPGVGGSEPEPAD